MGLKSIIQNSRTIRFGLWYYFRNLSHWREAPDRLYAETLDQIAWSENHGFEDASYAPHSLTHSRSLAPQRVVPMRLVRPETQTLTLLGWFAGAGGIRR